MAAAALEKNSEAIMFSFEAYERHDPFQIQSSKGWPDNKYLVAIPEYGKILEMLKLN